MTHNHEKASKKIKRHSSNAAKRAHEVVAQLRQREDIGQAGPHRGRPIGRWQLPRISDELTQQLQTTSTTAQRYWRYIAMIERFPLLASPAYTMAQILAIERVLAYLPPESHDAKLAMLLLCSLAELRQEYQAARASATERRARAKRLKQRQRRQRLAQRLAAQKGELKPPRRPAKVTGALWYERIVEVRQHLLVLKHEGLVENLAENWSPQNLDGYLNELDHVIDELISVKQRMQRVYAERVKLRLVNSPEDA